MLPAWMPASPEWKKKEKQIYVDVESISSKYTSTAGSDTTSQVNEDDFITRPQTSSILYNPRRLLTVVFVAIGILAVAEHAVRFFSSSFQETFFPLRAGAQLNLNAAKSHPMDDVLLHYKNTTGAVRHGGKRKALVVASLKKEHTEWVKQELSDWEANIYVVDDKFANHTVLINHGHETAAYLSYIINHYYDLPDYVAFQHAQRYQWHNDDPMYDGVQPLRNLQLPYVDEVGYASLRCAWAPGCPTQIYPDLNVEDGFWDWHGAYSHSFIDIFPNRPLPPSVAAPCCAQFAVSRAAILNNTIMQYEKMREWLWNTNIPDGKSGRITEYLWHVLFGMPAVSCPDTETCYCRVFGQCGLQCGEGRCEGRWEGPPFAIIPEGWPWEGQGGGWVEYGWWKKWYPNQEFNLEYIRDGMAERGAAKIASMAAASSSAAAAAASSASAGAAFSSSIVAEASSLEAAAASHLAAASVAATASKAIATEDVLDLLRQTVTSAASPTPTA